MIRRTLYTVPSTPAEVRTEFLREADRSGVRILAELGEFFIADGEAPNLIWATDVAHAFEVEIPSIAQGAKALREVFRENAPDTKPQWILLPGNHHRRATLIAETLRAKVPAPLSFPPAPWICEPLIPSTPRPAGFFLLTPEKALAVFSSRTPLPGGSIDFAEEKKGPPSRAYLKIWEALTRVVRETEELPKAGDRVVDLGSCPGGWTWALARLGCEVVSIDGAPLDPSVDAMPGVHFLKRDAFKMDPKEIAAAFPNGPAEKIDWVFSDMICEPKRLPVLLKKWIDSGLCERFVISVKFKGESDLAAIRELEALGGKLRHLRQNKHEVTWFRVPGLRSI